MYFGMPACCDCLCRWVALPEDAQEEAAAATGFQPAAADNVQPLEFLGEQKNTHNRQQHVWGFGSVGWMMQALSGCLAGWSMQQQVSAAVTVCIAVRAGPCAEQQSKASAAGGEGTAALSSACVHLHARLLLCLPWALHGLLGRVAVEYVRPPASDQPVCAECGLLALDNSQ